MEATTKVKIENQISDLAEEMARNVHERNYWRCQVWPDGAVEIVESVGRDELTVLPDSMRNGNDHNIQGAAVLLQVGTGSCACTCDACAAGTDPVGDDDASAYEDMMIEALDQIGEEYWQC